MKAKRHDRWWKKCFKPKINFLLLCFPFSVIGSDSPSLYRNMCKYKFKSGQYKGFAHSTIIKPSCSVFCKKKDARQPQLSFVGLVGECTPIFTFFFFFSFFFTAIINNLRICKYAVAVYFCQTCQMHLIKYRVYFAPIKIQ